MNEKLWNDFAYIWANHLEINWYHARADVDEIRKILGDDKALKFMCNRVLGSEAIPLYYY